jgi:hypothetical protein
MSIQSIRSKRSQRLARSRNRGGALDDAHVLALLRFARERHTGLRACDAGLWLAAAGRSGWARPGGA